MTLSEDMRRGLQIAERGGIEPLRGGWWVASYDAPDGYETGYTQGTPSVGTQTVRALESRGLLEAAGDGKPWQRRRVLTDAGRTQS